jgi:hypothetical protein
MPILNGSALSCAAGAQAEINNIERSAIMFLVFMQASDLTANKKSGLKMLLKNKKRKNCAFYGAG